MRTTLFIVIALVVGICVGAIVPHIAAHHVDTSWRDVMTPENHFGVSYNTSVVFTDLPMPYIKSVSGRAKFLDGVGPGQSTKLGFIINIEMSALDLAKVPQRYKQEKKEMINGFETTVAPIDQAYYAIELDFDLGDKDGFVLQTVHAKDLPSLVSGTKNTFQAAVEDPIPYATAMKAEQIVVRPSIVKCHTCQPKIDVQPDRQR